jgi:hypothetical protein
MLAFPSGGAIPYLLLNQWKTGLLFKKVTHFYTEFG